jgi:hypothetical protein
MLANLKYQDIEAIIGACDALRVGSGAAFDTVRDSYGGEAGDMAAEHYRLQALIEGLAEDALMELEALMWTGRHDGGRSFGENLFYAHRNKNAGVASYPANSWMTLPKYLREGLSTFKAL